jgi:hypothetical protein
VRTLGSRILRGRGMQNLLCAYLAAAVLVGLLSNALFCLERLEPAAALVVPTVAVKDRGETWRGEGCGADCWAPEVAASKQTRPKYIARQDVVLVHPRATCGGRDT